MSAFFTLVTTNSEDMNLDTDLQLDLEGFRNGLRSRFPGVEVYFQDLLQDTHMCLRWELNYYNIDLTLDSMSGEMARNHRWIYLDAHSKPETVAKFILWYRTFADKQYRLYVTGSWAVNYQEVTNTMTTADILQVMGSL